MTIVKAPPLRGRKRLICRGDEARVSKLFTPEGVLVERYQSNKDFSPTHSFRLYLSRNHWDSCNPGIRSYPLCKYQSLRLAGLLFPDNIVKVRRLHIKGTRSWMYSDFVPDDSGVIGRIKANRKRFLEAEDGERRERIRDEMDEQERRLNPSLEPLAYRIGAAGISLAHPEANYHVDSGRTVFFEVDGLDLRRLILHIEATEGIDREGALSNLAMLMACYARIGARVRYQLAMKSRHMHLIRREHFDFFISSVAESFRFMRSCLEVPTKALLPHLRNGLLELVKDPPRCGAWIEARKRDFDMPYSLDERLV